MKFERHPAKCWQQDIPGARWLKADLHIHTIDDYPGGNAKVPPELSGDPHNFEVLLKYARLFLKKLVARKVQVAGLTPHAPFMPNGTGASAVWSIVREWNEGIDEDGVPFRKKIYAVFPGFEPSFLEGKAGLHLLFLFDPEIGRSNLKVFFK